MRGEIGRNRESPDSHRPVNLEYRAANNKISVSARWKVTVLGEPHMYGGMCLHSHISHIQTSYITHAYIHT